MQINTKFIPVEPDVYIVGGSIRDILMDREPIDFDITVKAPCEPLAHRIAARAGSRAVPVGKPGARIYRIKAGNLNFDVAPMYGNSIEADLERRDFTVNAMAWDIARARLIDPMNGQNDIRFRRIRMVSAKNLEDDPIRLLRAFRLGATLSFSIAAETKAAIQALSRHIQQAAGERIREEWLKLLSAGDTFFYIRGMDDTGLLPAIFPELAALKNCRQNGHHVFDAFSHTMCAFSHLEALVRQPEGFLPEQIQIFQAVPSDPVLLKFALLLHDIGKPVCRSIDAKGGIHFYRHESVGADMASAISRRLRLSNPDRAYMTFIIGNHLRPLLLFMEHQVQKLTRKAIVRFFTKSAPLAPDLLIHAIADARGKKADRPQSSFESFCRQLIRIYLGEYLPHAALPPLISGHDLIREFHLTPSPLFSELLSRVETERLAGRLQSREEALEWIKNFLLTISPLDNHSSFY